MTLTWCATAALRTSFKLLQIYSYTDTSWDDDRNSCKSTCSSCITPFHMHSLMSPDALALLSDALPPLALLLPSPDALALLPDALLQDFSDSSPCAVHTHAACKKCSEGPVHVLSADNLSLNLFLCFCEIRGLQASGRYNALPIHM